MAKQDFIIKQQAALSSDPSTPSAGYMIIYPKTDGKWYSIDSAGTIIQVTNVAGGSFDYPQILLTQIFS